MVRPGAFRSTDSGWVSATAAAQSRKPRTTWIVHAVLRKRSSVRLLEISAGPMPMSENIRRPVRITATLPISPKSSVRRTWASTMFDASRSPCPPPNPTAVQSPPEIARRRSDGPAVGAAATDSAGAVGTRNHHRSAGARRLAVSTDWSFRFAGGLSHRFARSLRVVCASAGAKPRSAGVGDASPLGSSPEPGTTRRTHGSMRPCAASDRGGGSVRRGKAADRDAGRVQNLTVRGMTPAPSSAPS